MQTVSFAGRDETFYPSPTAAVLARVRKPLRGRLALDQMSNTQQRSGWAVMSPAPCATSLCVHRSDEIRANLPRAVNSLLCINTVLL
jgi:hypothetical protein